MPNPCPHCDLIKRHRKDCPEGAIEFMREAAPVYDEALRQMSLEYASAIKETVRRWREDGDKVEAMFRELAKSIPPNSIIRFDEPVGQPFVSLHEEMHDSIASPSEAEPSESSRSDQIWFTMNYKSETITSPKYEASELPVRFNVVVRDSEDGTPMWIITEIKD